MTPPQAAPGTALQISLDARFAATWFCLLPGHNVLARQTVTATRQLVVWWPRRSEDTGAGGLISSVLVLTPTIRTHCLRGWEGAGGLISSLAVLTPTIRTHCVRRWGQRPELLGHQFWPRRTGRWHRAEGLSLWTPTGWVTIELSQMVEAPCKGTWHVRAPFDLDTDRLTHPRVATPGAPLTGHSAMGPYPKWRVINCVCQLNKVGRQH